MKSKTTTYRNVIYDALAERSETMEDVVCCNLPDDEMYKVREVTEMGAMHDTVKFTLWTESRVYFPVVDDEMAITHIESVSRNPCNERVSF